MFRPPYMAVVSILERQIYISILLYYSDNIVNVYLINIGIVGPKLTLLEFVKVTR